MIDRVRYASILGYLLVCEVDLAFLVYGYVLEKRIATDGVVDVRFRLLVEVDDLCIAAAFEVEYSFVVPAVLVVTDKKTFRICRKGGLTCS